MNEDFEQNVGLECEVCGLADVRMLTRACLSGESFFTLCGNCFFLAGKQQMTVEELRQLRFPEGDQRKGERRNVGLRRFSSRREQGRREQGRREQGRREQGRRE